MTRPNTRLTEGDKSDIRNKVQQLLLKRRRLAANPSLETKEDCRKLYMSIVPSDIRKIDEHLREAHDGVWKGAVNLSDNIVVKLKKGEGFPPECFTLYFDKSCIMPGGWNSKVAVADTHPTWEPLQQWAKRARALQDENDLLYQRVNNMLYSLNTYGQINRVWPDLLPTLDNTAKVNAAQSQVRSSQLPDHFDADEIRRLGAAGSGATAATRSWFLISVYHLNTLSSHSVGLRELSLVHFR